MTVPTNLPRSWAADSDTLHGYALVDKVTLIGRPMRIRAVRFTENDKGIEYVYVDAEMVNGDMVQFNDSSTGIRAQLLDYVNNTLGRGDVIEMGEPLEMKLVIPFGLRVSEFIVPGTEGTSRERKARTFYLTTDGTPIVPLEVEPVTDPPRSGRQGRAGAGRPGPRTAAQRAATATHEARGGSDGQGAPSEG